MANVIVVAVVIVLLGFALKGTLKHLKGESPCCGGGDTIIIEDKKLDGPVIGKKDRENFWYALRSLRQSRNRSNQQNRRGFCKGQPEKERSSRFLRKGCRRCSDPGSCRKGRIYRTEHSGLSYVKLQHCSACKNETGFLIAFQKKICYNNSVGSKEIWRSALFSFMTIECSQSVHSTVSTKAALISICRFSGEESSDSKYKR